MYQNAVHNIPTLKKAWEAAFGRARGHDDVPLSTLCNDIDVCIRRVPLHASATLIAGAARTYVAEASDLLKDSESLLKAMTRRRRPVPDGEDIKTESSTTNETDIDSDFVSEPGSVSATHELESGRTESSTSQELEKGSDSEAGSMSPKQQLRSYSDLESLLSEIMAAGKRWCSDGPDGENKQTDYISLPSDDPVGSPAQSSTADREGSRSPVSVASEEQRSGARVARRLRRRRYSSFSIETQHFTAVPSTCGSVPRCSSRCSRLSLASDTDSSDSLHTRPHHGYRKRRIFH